MTTRRVSTHGPTDPRVTLNRIEQRWAGYSTPNVEVRNQVVVYRAGKVGRLEVLRDARVAPLIKHGVR